MNHLRVAFVGALSSALVLSSCASEPEPRCVAGVSVACVGVGGCAGGQVCNAAGSGFGPCECGAADAGIVDAGAVDAGLADAGPGEAGPGDAGIEDMNVADLGGLRCSPIDHAACAPDERCAWVVTSTDLAQGTLRCVPAGRVVDGGACTVGPDGEATGYDDCARGLHCLSGVCKRVCDPSTPSSCGDDLCVIYAGLFVPTRGGTSIAGLCSETCDPVTQLRLDGSACGPGRGCFGSLSDGAFACAAAYSTRVHGDAIEGPLYVNACAAGFIPLFSSLDRTTTLCTALCRPVETHAGAPGGAAGVPPHACPDRGAGSPPNDCVFAATFAADPTDSRLTGIGVCFDRTGRLYDADGDGTNETPWPSCAELVNTDTDGDGIPEHAEFGCAPTMPGT
jgi:hypothetical protein